MSEQAGEPGSGGTAPGTPPVPKRKPTRKPLPSPLAVIVATLGLLLVVLTLLAIQVRNGRDPALGPGPVVPALSKPTAGKAAQAQATTIVSRTSPAPPP